MTVPYPLPFPATNPDDAPLHTVQFNEDWLPIILRATEDYYAIETWDGAPSDRLAVLDQLTAQLMTNIIISPQGYPRYEKRFHQDSIVQHGNNLLFTAVSTVPYNALWNQNPPAIHDEFSFDVFLDTGEYNFVIAYRRNTTCGIADFYMDAESTPFWSKDMYGSLLDNQIDGGFFTLTEPGNHTITCKMDTKNASASNYAAILSWFKCRWLSA